MRVLVTGAGGFLGRHVVERLLARGDEVQAVDLAFGTPIPGATCTEASVTDVGAMRAAAAGVDAVIHGAAQTGLWSRDAEDYERVNHGGTRTVLAAAAEAGARRAVLISSFTTLIAGRRSDPPATLTEVLELPPGALHGPYPRSKRLAEIAASGPPLPAVILLPTAPIGPGDRTPTPPGAMLRDLANGRLPAMIDATWDLVDVRALADTAVAALERGTPGERYICGGEAMDTEGLLARAARVSGRAMPRFRVPWGVALAAAHAEERIARLTGGRPKAPVSGVLLAGPRLTFSSDRARRELGHAPGPAEDAMAAALAWMRDQGWVGPLPAG